MDYSKLSDFEINKRVADIAMNGTWHVKPSHPDNDTGGWLYGSNGIKTYELPDYCNNPADAWPIIAENRITVMIDDTTNDWSAAVVQDFCDSSAFKFSNCHKNPLRASMVTFLMMHEAANVQTDSTR
ncbi:MULTISPECIES: phage protein NinX family protein [Citrobacter]|uniref:phage protein NinX family protein n=1 Tax=Citrobacter TaxID=544 RepID=UPI00244A530F|nr:MULTISPECIES: phage protein NinX family protein [Citrobacter]MDH0387956.1 DUF2591 family protein [Citrobacter freundii]MDM3135221.1 DUF2591 family protein [Citrobacter sp. Cf123]